MLNQKPRHNLYFDFNVTKYQQSSCSSIEWHKFTKAANMIQNFYRTCKKYQNLKQDCLHSGNLLKYIMLKKIELLKLQHNNASIEEIYNSIPDNVIFILNAYAAKMVSRSIEFQTETSMSPQYIENLHDLNSTNPNYMREVYRYDDEIKKFFNTSGFKKAMINNFMPILKLLFNKKNLKNHQNKNFHEDHHSSLEELDRIISNNHYMLEYFENHNVEDKNQIFTEEQQTKKIYEELSNYVHADLKCLLQNAGATTSYYKVIEHLNTEMQQQFPPYKAISFLYNNKIAPSTRRAAHKKIDLTNLIEHATKIKKILNHASYENHILLYIVIALIKGLQDYELQFAQATNNNLETTVLFNENFFYMMDCCLQLMYTFRDHFQISNNLYIFFIDELAGFLMFNKCKPINSYNNILQKLYIKRIEVIAKHVKLNNLNSLGSLRAIVATKEDCTPWECISFLTSSGMGAIMAALYNVINQIAQDKCNVNLTYAYYEIYDLINTLAIQEEESNIIFATLEPSTPETYEKFDFTIYFNKLIETIEKRVTQIDENEFVNLIVDVTIESGTYSNNKLQQLLKKFELQITNGQINIVLVKSFQKYALLGTSKLMAGNISIINNGHKKFQQMISNIKNFCEKQKLEENIEYTFMAHLLIHANVFEIDMINKAIDNANYLKNLLNNFIDETDQMDGSPFVFISYSKIPAILLDKYLNIHEMDSFGFIESSYVSIGDNDFRLNLGIDSKGSLTENFFALNIPLIMNQDQKEIYSIDLKKLILELISFSGTEFEEELTYKSEIEIFSNHQLIELIIENLISQFSDAHNEGSNKDIYKNQKIYSIFVLILKIAQDIELKTNIEDNILSHKTTSSSEEPSPISITKIVRTVIYKLVDVHYIENNGKKKLITNKNIPGLTMEAQQQLKLIYLENCIANALNNNIPENLEKLQNAIKYIIISDKYLKYIVTKITTECRKYYEKYKINYYPTAKVVLNIIMQGSIISPITLLKLSDIYLEKTELNDLITTNHEFDCSIDLMHQAHNALHKTIHKLNLSKQQGYIDIVDKNFIFLIYEQFKINQGNFKVKFTNIKIELIDNRHLLFIHTMEKLIINFEKKLKLLIANDVHEITSEFPKL